MFRLMVIPSQVIPFLLMILFLTGCIAVGDNRNDDSMGTINVSVLIHGSSDDFRWFRDVETTEGSNAYELTKTVVQGDLESTYYASLFSHLVESIFGKRNEDPNYWTIFLWDDNQKQWAPLPLGADLFSLKNGHVIGWVYTEYGQEVLGLPSP